MAAAGLAEEVRSGGPGDLLEHGPGELLDLGWERNVAVGGGGSLAVVSEPVEHGDQGLAGGQGFLAGVDQRPAVSADRVAGGARQLGDNARKFVGG